MGLARAAERLFVEWELLAKRLGRGPTKFSQVEASDLFSLLKGYLLLSALALENLLKGALIGQDPSVADGKRISWGVGKGDHDLLALCRRLGRHPSQPEVDLLEALTEAIQWAGRYPTPKLYSSGPKYALRLAKKRDAKLVVGESLAAIADFHRQTYEGLFLSVFESYPVPTAPWTITSTTPDRPTTDSNDG
jgi:hypothetical protein